MRSKRRKVNFVLNLRKQPFKMSDLLISAKKFQLNKKQTAALADISLRTMKQKSKDSRVSINASEKIVKLKNLFEIGLTTFDNNESSLLTWLHGQVPALGNRIPVNLITTHLGIDLVMEELLRIEHSVY